MCRVFRLHFNTIEILKENTDSRIELVKNKENVGVAKANNQGIKLAIQDNCTQVLIINNDVEFDTELIARLLAVQKEKAAVVW